MPVAADSSNSENSNTNRNNTKTHQSRGLTGSVSNNITMGRRALGDIGNLVGALTRSNNNNNNNAGGKDDAAKLLNNLRDGKSSKHHNGVSQALASMNGRDTRSNSVSGIGSWGASRPRTSLLRPRSESVGAVPSSLSNNDAIQGHKQARNYAFSLLPNLPDIDSASDKNNPLMVTEIVNDIYSYYRSVEPEMSVPADYMSKQSDINDRMRAILIDWLVEVHLKFKLIPETLYLAHNLIDRFLMKKNVMRKNLQLVGVTAMLIASKYEEIYAPEVRDFVYISDKAYTRDQILGMEKLMLNTLRFNLTVPTSFHFMSRFLKAAGADKTLELMTGFLLELSLSDYSLVKYPASQMASAAVYASLRTLRRIPPVYPGAHSTTTSHNDTKHNDNDSDSDKSSNNSNSNSKYWSLALERHSGYTENQIKPIAMALARSHAKAASGSTSSAVYKKYSHAKYQEVARISPSASLLNE